MSEHPDIVVPEGAGFVPPEGVDFVVPEGEKLLWICRRPMPPATWDLVTLGVLLTLVAGCGIIYCLAEAELTGKLALIFGGLFLFIIAVGLASLVHQRRVVRRTTYVLTDKKAYIQERLDKAADKWLVISFEVHPYMIHKVKRRRNGTVDYVLGKEHRGSLTLSTGFLHLPPELDPAAIFEQLSATMPVKGEKKRAVCEYKRPTPALLSVFGYSLLTCFFATGFILGYDNHGADLYVLGEETTAKVVTYEQGTEKRGRRNRREVTVYYPIVAFHTADGRTCVTNSQTGYDKSPACEPGDTVQILYHPDEPRYATIKDDSILIRPLVMLGGIIWALWSVWKEMRRWRRERRSAVIEVECSSRAE